MIKAINKKNIIGDKDCTINGSIIFALLSIQE